MSDPARARVPYAVLSAVEWLVLLVVLILAWKARSVWPSVAVADSDTPGYLDPALSWLGGDGFRQQDGRDWLYPALVAFFLKTSGSFTGVVVWQRILGLLSGVLMGFIWRSWVSLLPVSRWVRFALTLLGALPIWIQLVNHQTILFEMSLRPEAVLPFAVYAQLACVIGYSKYRWQAPCARRSFAFGTASLALAWACLLLKPSWYFACVTTALPVCCGVFGHALSLKTRLLTPVAGMVAGVLLFVLPGKMLMKPDRAARTLLPDALFCVHVQLIDRLFKERLSTMPENDPGKAKLQALVNMMDTEIQNAANDHHAYEILGINADYLMHNHAFTAAIYEYAGNDREKFRAFCFSSFFSAVAHYPVAYTRKVLLQFTHFLYPDPRSLYRDNINMKQSYRDTVDALRPELGTELNLDPQWQKVYAVYQAQLAEQLASAKTTPTEDGMRVFRKILSRVVVPVDVLFLLALLGVHLWKPLHPLRLGGWSAFFLFLAPFGNAFGVCVVHTLDIFRYRATLAGYLLYALTAMALFVIVTVAQAVLVPLRRPTSDTRI